LTEVVNRLENGNYLCECLQVQLIMQEHSFYPYDAKASVKVTVGSLWFNVSPIHKPAMGIGV
jgi:hypothetical protein